VFSGKVLFDEEPSNDVVDRLQKKALVRITERDCGTVRPICRQGIVEACGHDARDGQGVPTIAIQFHDWPGRNRQHRSVNLLVIVEEKRDRPVV